MKYILSIDQGSQSTKVLLFDLEGHPVCSTAAPLKPMNLPKLGWVEHPDDDLWDSLVEACRALMDRFDGDPEDIVCAGLCSIRFDRVLTKKDGLLAQPVLSWMDERVSVPFDHHNPDVAYVVSTNGYLTRRMTGLCRDTVSTYQGQWPIDTDAWEWSEDPSVIERYHIPRNMLFDLIMPGEILGTISEQAAEILRLPAGLPLAATGNDKAVEALGTGMFSADTALISLGTYICGMVYGDTNPKDMKNFWVNFSSIPKTYLYESYGIRRGMWLISWFKELLGKEVFDNASALGITSEEYLGRAAAEISPGSDGLLVVPEWLPPAGLPFKRGMMLGFDARHKTGHIYRSIMEGIAMTMKNRMDEMGAELDIKFNRMILSGGGSNSDLFMQIFADVFGIEVSRNEVTGAAALGSAICAAVAVGIYSSFEEAIKKMVHVRDTFIPVTQNFDLYKKINEGVYRDITKTTDPLLKKSYDIFVKQR